jgi:hypothetical protein
VHYNFGQNRAKRLREIAWRAKPYDATTNGVIDEVVPVFGIVDDCLHFDAAPLTGERGDADADLVARLIDLEPGMTVLDLACGHGRIANPWPRAAEPSPGSPLSRSSRRQQLSSPVHRRRLPQNLRPGPPRS